MSDPFRFDGIVAEPSGDDMSNAASDDVDQQGSDASWLAGGARPEVVTVGDPRLRVPVAPIDDVDAVAGQVDAMVALLREMRGAGLAAPQVGWSAAAVVVEVRKTEAFPDRPESPLFVLLNPEIVDLADGQVVEDWEGCFSVPGLVGRVPRASSVTVRYTGRDGQDRTETFEGYVARVVQHELDHLEGKVFLDRMATMASLSTIANWQRFGGGPS
jgi:peptide deformylase